MNSVRCSRTSLNTARHSSVSAILPPPPGGVTLKYWESNFEERFAKRGRAGKRDGEERGGRKTEKDLEAEVEEWGRRGGEGVMGRVTERNIKERF